MKQTPRQKLDLLGIAQDKVDKGRPEYGKIYRLTGTREVKAISNGNTWKESEVQ